VTLRVVVDTASPVPPWQQLTSQLSQLIGAGTLTAGTRLPPIRQLARDLGLAPGTVARSYRELESVGWVTTAGAKGTVVAQQISADPGAMLRDAAAQYADTARRLGYDADTAAAAVKAAWR
jgi:DNA-binding transcriptional regulator YhcF (GntR family)